MLALPHHQFSWIEMDVLRSFSSYAQTANLIDSALLYALRIITVAEPFPLTDDDNQFRGSSGRSFGHKDPGDEGHHTKASRNSTQATSSPPLYVYEHTNK
jgi:hypothetical protein